MLAQDAVRSAPEPEGRSRSNEQYSIPGMERKISIRDAAYYYVGQVLSISPGGRAPIKDVVGPANQLFLRYNPGGWKTKNRYRADQIGGFTAAGLKHIGQQADPKARKGRWTQARTFRVEEGDTDMLIYVAPEERPGYDAAEAEAEAEHEDYDEDISEASGETESE